MIHPGNLAGKAPLGLKTARPSKSAGRAHMARVAQLPCVACGAMGVQVHHVIHDRFSQRRASDFDTIPLCKRHHDELHADKTAWRAKYGADHEYLPGVADALAGELNSPWRHE